MKNSKILKVIAIFLSCALIFQQTGFAQVASVELDITGRLASFHNALSFDKFRPLHLRSISYDGLNNNFKLLLDKGDTGNLKTQDLELTTKDLLNYFFVGIALPNSAFKVNLRPDSPNDIIDPLLAQTDVGKILLEADLQLKKDTANATNPQTPEGREYWNLLYQKAAEIYGNQNVTIPTLTRPWIVPDEIIIRESTDSAYVYKATLKVMLEQDYLKDNAMYSFKDEREKQLNEYSAQIIRENIIPKLTKEINNSKRYAALRQVYYSLILAQWFKARNQNKNTKYSGKIDRKDLTNLQAKIPYSVGTYFNAYKENFAKGEYNIKEPVSTPYGQVIRSYFSGGMILAPDNTLLAQELAKPLGIAGNKAVLSGAQAEIKSKHDVSVEVDGDVAHVMAKGVAEAGARGEDNESALVQATKKEVLQEKREAILRSINQHGIQSQELLENKGVAIEVLGTSQAKAHEQNVFVKIASGKIQDEFGFVQQPDGTSIFSMLLERSESPVAGVSPIDVIKYGLSKDQIEERLKSGVVIMMDPASVDKRHGFKFGGFSAQRERMQEMISGGIEAGAITHVLAPKELVVLVRQVFDNRIEVISVEEKDFVLPGFIIGNPVIRAPDFAQAINKVLQNQTKSMLIHTVHLPTLSEIADISFVNKEEVRGDEAEKQVEVDGDLVHVMAKGVQESIPPRDQIKQNEISQEYLKRLEIKYDVKIIVANSQAELNNLASQSGLVGVIGNGFGYFDRASNQAYVYILAGHETDSKLLMHEITEALARQSEGVAVAGAQTVENGQEVSSSEILNKIMVEEVEAAAKQSHLGWYALKNKTLLDVNNPFVGKGPARVRVRDVLDKSGQLVMTPEELSQRVGAKVSQEKYQAIQNAVKEGKTGQDITHNWFTEDYEAVLASEPDGGIDLASRNALPNLVLAMYLTDYRGSEIKTREGLLRVLKGLIDGSDVKGIDAVSRLNHVAFQSLVLGQGERGYEAEVRARIGAAVKKAARTDFAPYEELYKEVKELDTYTLLPAAQWLRERVENGQEVDVDIVQQGVESTINGNSAVDYFDPDQNRAMDFLNNDPQAWVSFTDMLKLSFRNDAYGRKIGDILIEDAIRIAKKVLHENRGIGFRLGDRSDEFAIVLPGSLKPEKAKNILLKIQKEIKDEYLKYSIARLPDGLAEKVKNISGVKDVSRVVRFNQNSTTVLFVKDSGDISGRLTLDRILREIGQESGEVNEVSVPYLPAGAVRFRGEGSLQDKLEASLKEAEIIQRVAKQAGELVGIEGLIEKPPIKEGATLNGVDSSKLETYIEKAKEYLPGLREFVKRHPDHGREKAKLVKLDTGLAAFMRPNLIEILEYVMELAKSADSFTFLVRGPPDSFYFVTCAKGKWQVIFVRQNILTVEGSNLQENFLSLRKASGRQGVPGKHTFKVINDFDELGHNFGNQIIKLENVSLLDAFNNQLEGAKEKGGILDEQSINAALSNASSSMNELINKNGIDFSVSFEAISIISDDYAERKNKTDTDIAEEIPGLIEVLNKNHKIVKISDDTVKFFSEYKDQWPNILAEKESSEAARSSEADAELAKADLFYSDSIKSLDNESEKDLAINQAEAAVGNSGLPAKDFNLKIFSKLGEEVYGWEIIVSQLMRLDPAVLVKHRNYLKSKVKNPVVYYIGIGGPNNSKGNLGAGPEIHIGIDVAIPLIESDFSVLVGADLESFNFQEFQNGIRINLGRVFDKTTGRCVTETLRFNKLLDNKFEATFTYDGVERKIIMYAGRDLMVADFIPEEIEGGFNVLTLNGAGFFTTPKTARRTLELLTLGKGVIFIGSDDQELYDARQTTSEFSQSISGRNIWKYLKENGYFSMQFIGVYEDYGGKRGIWCVNKNSVLADSVGQDNLPILPLAQPQGNPGGIDFRFLPIVTQSLDNLKADIRFMPQSSLQRINLTKEWSDIERLVNSGITPSAERLREYFAASYVDGSLDSDMNKIISCISDILRMEEQDCSLTDPVLKDILVVLWSGRSAKELKLAFAN